MSTSNSSTGPAHDDELDAQGLRCPEPLLLVRNRLRGMAKGQVLHILATDPSTTRDFHNLCRFMGHELMAERIGVEPLHYWIRKG
jgi:tRNA 2-thiouridine synthesizing protein A